MCMSVYVDGKELDTRASLCRALPGAHPFIPDPHKASDGDLCLCGTPLDKIAEATGREYLYVNDGSNYLLLPGQRYEWECGECGRVFDVRDENAQWDHRHDGRMCAVCPRLAATA